MIQVSRSWFRVQDLVSTLRDKRIGVWGVGCRGYGLGVRVSGVPATMHSPETRVEG